MGSGRGVRATALACCVGAAFAGSAAAAPRADLTVTKLGVAPARAAVGLPFSLSTQVRNVGKRKAPASVVRAYISYDGVKGPGDLLLLGSKKMTSLRPGRAASAKLRLTLPKKAPQERLLLVVCADDTRRVRESKEGNNCRAAGRRTEVFPPVTTLDLIERERTQGKITDAEALTYKMRAVFGAPDAPARFRATDAVGDLDSAGVVHEVAYSWDDLPAATRKALDPYFSPPIYKGARGWGPGSSAAVRHRASAEDRSCMNGTLGGAALRQEDTDAWDHIDTEHFRFWYYTVPDLDPGGLLEGFNGNPAASRFLAEQLAAVAEQIYDAETALFAREPLSDASLACNGGDGRIDVYAAKLSIKTAAQVHPYGSLGESLKPGWVHISPSYANTSTKIRDVFAHEFAHLIQLAYDYKVQTHGNLDYMWLEEASANWAVDYVYPADNFEHQFAKTYLLDYGFNNPLNVQAGFYSGSRGGNGYEDYLFLWYVTRNAGNPLIMRTIWNRTESYNSVKAVDGAIPGGFKDRWREFGVYNVNRGGEDFYRDWDSLQHMFSLAGDRQPRVEISLGGTKRRTIPMPGDRNRSIYQLSMNYTSFDVTDPKVRGLTFRDYGFRDVEPGQAIYADVQAWIELANGQTRVEDWNDGEDVTFCRDRAGENVKRLVLIYSFGEPRNQAAGEGQSEVFFPETRRAAVEATRRCSFPAKFTGSASGSMTQDGRTQTWSATITLDKDIEGGGVASYGKLEEPEGTANWTLTGTDSYGCTLSGGGSLKVEAELGIGDFSDDYTFRLGKGESGAVNITQNCPWGSGSQLWDPLNFEGGPVCGPGYPAGQWSGTGQLTGSAAYKNGGADYECSWSLSPVP